MTRKKIKEFSKTGIYKNRVRKFAILKLKAHENRFLNNKPIAICKSSEILNLYFKCFGSTAKDDFEKSKEETINSGTKVYVIGNIFHGLCKIGFSSNPSKRLKQIQTGCPFEVYLLLVFDGDSITEKALHYKYREYRARRKGEWFEIKGRLKDSIFSKMNISKTIKPLTI